MHGGENRDAHIDFLADGLDLEAAVLRFASFGDVERAHDLDAAHHGVVEGFRRGGTLHEFAVDAVAESRGVFQCLEVDVGRLRLQRLDHHGVHHADHGRVFVRSEGGVEDVRRLHFGKDLELGLVALHDGFHREGGVGGVPRRLQAGQGVRYLLFRGNAGPDVSVCGARYLFQGREVEGVGKGDCQASAQLGDRNGLCLDPKILIFATKQILVDSETIWKRERRHVEIGCRSQRERCRVDEVFLDKVLLQRRLSFRRLPRYFLELFSLQHLASQQRLGKVPEVRTFLRLLNRFQKHI